MTREEAITRIKIHKSVHGMSEPRAIHISKALDMAIKALEQEPYDDCISRQAAIDSLGECPMNWTDSDGEITAERDWKDTVEMLKRLPSVNPQPKTEVLDKIRDEIDTQEEWLSEAGYNAYNVDIAFNAIKLVLAESEV